MDYSVFSMLCDKKGTTPTAVALKLGLSKGNTSSWKKGGNPNADILMKLADELNCTTDLLLGRAEKDPTNFENDEIELLEIYKKLNSKDKIRIIERAQTLYEIASEKSESAYTPIISIRHSLYMVSAGTGYELDAGDSWDEIEVPDTPTARKADFCLTISGDSMEPRYHNGDIVLVKHCNAIDENEIGIFRIENKGYIKRYGLDRLISLNPKYDDILFSDYDSQDIQCLGLVIGKA